MDGDNKMNVDTQHLIIYILGADSILMILGLFSLLIFTNYDVNIILALLSTVASPIGILGGFLTGKSITEVKQEEILPNECLNDEME